VVLDHRRVAGRRAPRGRTALPLARCHRANERAPRSIRRPDNAGCAGSPDVVLDEDCRATGTPRSRHLTRRWRGDHAVAQLIGPPHSSIAAPWLSKASPPFRLIADRRDPTPSLSILDG